ncbi:MAG TPA: alkaline phosphatase [Anaerolineae bacterium]|nr:alkaline phosphatase [Anaerolineae bacterium]
MASAADPQSAARSRRPHRGKIGGLRLLLLLIICSATASTPPPPRAGFILVAPPPCAPPTNIILFIGDGMGEAQRTAARWAAHGQERKLAMDFMPHQGWARTESLLGVTDSAAAATALATGHKTLNGMLAMDSLFNPLPTILEQAQRRGMAVGLVSLTEIAHATPAAFAAHVPLRSQMEDIALQMIERKVTVLLGGGEDTFLPPSMTGCFPTAGNRSDGRNLIQEAIEKGYTYTCDGAHLMTAAEDASRLLGLFDDAGMTRPHSPTLATMTHAALIVLSQDPEGFFLMVEGGQIDWAAHANDAENVIGDTLAFDDAVAIAQAFAVGRPQTLIIVTADHETGGMALSRTRTGAEGEDGPLIMPDGTPFYVTWTGGEHTTTPVPVTAQGPVSYLLDGEYENTHLYEVMLAALFNWRIDVPAILRQ